MSDSTSPSWSTDQGTSASASRADSSVSRVVVSFNQNDDPASDTVCSTANGTAAVDTALSVGRLADAFVPADGVFTIPEDGLYKIDLSASAAWGTAPVAPLVDTYSLEVLLVNDGGDAVAATRSSITAADVGMGNRLDYGLATSGSAVVLLSKDDVLTLRCIMNEVVTATGAAIANATTSTRSVSAVMTLLE